MIRYYEGENAKLDAEMRKLRRLPVEEDSFNNRSDSLSDYPEWAAWLRGALELEGFKLISRRLSVTSAGIGPGYFELQRHTSSVDEHTDDLEKGVYFGLFVVKSSRPVKSRRGYSTESELRYFDAYGAKTRYSLLPGHVIVFNPRREHELIYYGEKTTFALFCVEKLKDD